MSEDIVHCERNRKCWVVQTQKSVPNEDKIWPLKNKKKGYVDKNREEKGKKILINRKKTYQIPIGR